MSQSSPRDILDNAATPIPKIKYQELKSSTIQGWNTKNLGLRLGTDVASAATASLLVAPVICVIDQSIVRKAATGASLPQALLNAAKPILFQPHRFFVSKPFLLIFSVYGSTYLTANTLDTAINTIQDKKASHVTAGPAKFAATSTVNMSMGIYKDSQFARMFGTTGAATSIPKVSFALFALRDSLTIFASFNLPTIIAPKLAQLPPGVKNTFSRILSTESGRLNTAQFLTPAAMQILSTPIHLLGLDLFNRQGKLGFSERALQITKNWAVCTFARMGRIIPAFGVGGVVNSQVRANGMRKIE